LFARLRLFLVLLVLFLFVLRQAEMFLGQVLEDHAPTPQADEPGHGLGLAVARQSGIHRLDLFGSERRRRLARDLFLGNGLVNDLGFMSVLRANPGQEFGHGWVSRKGAPITYPGYSIPPSGPRSKSFCGPRRPPLVSASLHWLYSGSVTKDPATGI